MVAETHHKIPKTVEKPFQAIAEIIKSFCAEHLNEEYQELAIKMLAKLARKRPSPLLSGRSNTWAAGIVHALGMVNFLFDKTQTPHTNSKSLCSYFNLGQSTVSGKSKSIRDMLKIHQIDHRWCLPSRLDDHPMVWMISCNGFIIDARTAPYEIQVAAYEAGVIPYIPGDRTN